MRKNIIATVIFLFSSSVQADDGKVYGHMDPLSNELLPISIKLPDCPGVEIIEWRPTPTQENQTSPTEKNIKLVNAVCKAGISNFFKFVKANHLKFKNNEYEFNITVCIMPAKLGFYGEGYRNLNDHHFRFKNRERRYESDGSIMGVWGYTRYEPLSFFVRNDVLNKHGNLSSGFATTFVHELFHTLSYHYGVYDLLSNNRSVRDNKEEQLAIKYENYVTF